MNIVLIILFLSMVVDSWGGEVSLIEKSIIVTKKTPIEKKKITQEEKPSKEVPIDQSFDQMKEFMRQEDDRIKAIKILNLDLERANLELKKGEIEVKIADLNRNQNVAVGSSGLPADFPKPALSKLCGIFVNGRNKKALMNVGGSYIQAGEGDTLRGGILVKSINADTVLLEYFDGKKEIINLGS